MSEHRDSTRTSIPSFRSKGPRTTAEQSSESSRRRATYKAMKEDSDQHADLIRISGNNRSEFPEPTITIANVVTAMRVMLA